MSPERKLVLSNGLAAAGGVGGILLAVKRKSGFWGGLGWFIVGGLAGRAVGAIAAAVIPGELEEKPVVVVNNNQTPA